MIEEIIALVMVFGTGAAVAISFSPVGRAFAERIRGPDARAGLDPSVYQELDRLRQEVMELQERVDFAERLLAGRREEERLPGGGR